MLLSQFIKIKIQKQLFFKLSSPQFKRKLCSRQMKHCQNEMTSFWYKTQQFLPIPIPYWHNWNM